MNRVLVSVLLMSTMSALGCARVVFVSERDGHQQIYKMRDSGQAQRNISMNQFPDRQPDASFDGFRVAFISTRGGERHLFVRDISDTTDSTTRQLTGTAAARSRPRWSADGQWIAFAEWAGGSGTRIFRIRSDSNEGSRPQEQVTTPGAGESDGGGHDFFDNGRKIVFSRRNSASGTYDLFWKNADGSGTANSLRMTTVTHETLPTVSHDGRYLAYLAYVPLATGWVEVISVVQIGSWAPLSVITMKEPAATLGPSVNGLSFSKDDTRLYVSAKVPGVAGASDEKYEIFLVEWNLPAADQVQTRLTDNTDPDYAPSAIPRF